MAVSRSCVEKMGLRWKKYKLLLRVRLKKKTGRIIALNYITCTDIYCLTSGEKKKKN